MKKKKYIMPEIKVYDIEPSVIMCTSDTTTVTSGGTTSETDDFTMESNSYRTTLWN